MTEADEREAVRRAQAGEAEAFGDLVSAHQQFVFNLALRTLGQPAEAEEVAQEAFLRAWRALPGFRGQARFQTWLYRIVVNLCYNRLPRLRRQLNDLGDDHLSEMPDPAAGPEALADGEADQRQAFLHAAIARLPEGQQLLLTLRFQQALSYEEIAAITSLPLGTVKTGLFRARARLREALRRYEADEDAD